MTKRWEFVTLDLGPEVLDNRSSMLVGEKSALKSVGVWGGILTLLPAADKILAIFGILQESLPPLMAAGLTIVGGVTAIIGRIKATKKIK